MILGYRRIEKCRISRICSFCRRVVEQDAVRLYGMSGTHDKPSMLFYHDNCYRLEKAGYTLEDLESSNPYTQGEGI